jgi:hypothetical protein
VLVDMPRPPLYTDPQFQPLFNGYVGHLSQTHCNHQYSKIVNMLHIGHFEEATPARSNLAMLLPCVSE